MTLDLPPAPNGPLFLQGEGWGEGTASTPNTAATGKRCSRASSLLRRAVPVLAWGLPARRAHNRGRGNGGSRWECQDDSEFTARSERPPLPLGEGWGEGAESTPNTAATGKRCSRASSLLRRAVPVLALGLPARRAHNRGRGNGGSRWECQDDSEFTACSERPPLPSGRGLGRGNGVNPNTAATWKRCSRASSLLRRAVPHLALGLPARRAHNRGRGNGGSRWECQDDSEFTACSERPPLPSGRGLGRGNGVNPKHRSHLETLFASKLAPMKSRATSCFGTASP
ncbi:hypothetical protein PcP3B5_18330 [Pseudomonas citronellolis]|nr:hypothetical protein PcP3B5_18330 [Pseudomonas citronellolis]